MKFENLKLLLLFFKPSFCGYFLALVFISCGSDKGSYEGLVFREINELEGFENYLDKGGVIVKDDFAFGSHIDTVTKTRIISYTEVISSRSGKVKYKIYDLLEVSPLGKDEYIAYGHCELNGEWNSLVVAIYKYEDEEYYTDITQAWQLDEQTKRFKGIPVTGIRCINEGYYL